MKYSIIKSWEDFLIQWKDKEPFYYYFTRFPIEFLPWSIFIPGVIIYSIKEKSKEFQSFHFPFVWFVVIFIFFLIASGKKGRYLLPLYPAASLLVAWIFDSLISES
jgi:4-amino-4-deoxy-L-arabinose transferase-like glycosyltransferase